MLAFLSISLLGCPDNCPEENCPPFRVRVWFRVSVRIKIGRQFSSRALVLESFNGHVKTYFFVQISLAKAKKNEVKTNKGTEKKH